MPAGDPDGELLVVGWGSTYGAITAALRAQRAKGRRVGHVHLRHLNPLPRNLGEVLKRYRRVLVPELNMGQLVWLLRAKYLVDAISYAKVQGKPFKQAELESKIEEILVAIRKTMAATLSALYTKKDFETDQEVRWCPGCGDYAILSAVQTRAAPSSACPRRSSWSSRASAARAASRTT